MFDKSNANNNNKKRKRRYNNILQNMSLPALKHELAFIFALSMISFVRLHNKIQVCIEKSNRL